MTTNSLTIKLTTLTPLWTGGADGTSDSGLHITGIMGSLRWWYEVLVRGVGGHVCSMNNPCIYDKQKEPYHGLCDVCRLFGATGWARRFKLIASEQNLQPKKPAASTIDRSGSRVFRLSKDHPTDHDPKWYLSGDPLYGDVTLEAITTLPLVEGKEKGKQPPVEVKEEQSLDPKVIGALIQLIADRGSIGAKPQMGLGVVRVVNRQSTQPLLGDLKQLVEKHKDNKDRKDYHAYDELPSLHNMFFARVKVSSTESDTFDLKYDIRGMFRQAFRDVDLRHTIMGSVHKGDRQGAKIMMSYPYDNGTIRIWGWIPKLAGTHPSHNEILDEIYSLLEDIYRDNFSYWLDFNPNKHGDIVEYLEEYILKEEK